MPAHVAAIDSLIILSNEERAVPAADLQPVATFQDSLFLNEISSVIADPTGAVYIAGESWKRTKIFKFQPDGTLTDSLGEYGTGFGEFQQISRLQFRRDDLYIFDGELNRVTIYDTINNEFTDTLGIWHQPDLIPVDWTGADSKPVALLGESSFLISLHKQRDPAYDPIGAVRYFRADSMGNSDWKPLYEMPDFRYIVGDYAGRPAPFTIPFPERPIAEVSAGDRIYSAYSEEFLIRVRDADGRELHSYYYPKAREPLDPDEEIHPLYSHNDQLLRVRESAQFPDEWPAIYSIIADDDNRIWISVITGDRNQLEWWVVDDRNGELIATFTWPFDKPVVHVQNGLIYTVEQDDMGFKIVNAYRLDLADEHRVQSAY
ncbi:hypothetical protein DYD21_19795 [Rhodohalobacter sp. SW132]|nr:hypothetical protein DYD21_19795 [Rhodohalobacter sp. SW132]